MRLSKLILPACLAVFFGVGLVNPSISDAQSETGAYRRGDSNQDGAQDITDGIEILGHVILGEPASIPCDKCFDVDDNGEKDINDGITLLRFVILGSADIPEPFRRCGHDPTPDSLTCSFYRPCRCGTIAGIPCRPGEICNPDPGSCDISDAAGYCMPEPRGGCPEFLDPVCGCDGVTYDNDCFRLEAGAQKDHHGPCRPDFCDGFAGIPCAEGQFCDHPAGTCNVADGSGVCVDVPDACPRIFDPVCGCNGTTYSNDCERVRAGAQKDHDGECRTVDVCGGIAGIPCDEGEICNLPAGHCQSADLQGVCVPRPEACPDVWDPVCGCDGETYSNDCDRLSAGAQKDHDGPCVSICGGIAGFPCDEDEFCDHGAGACDIADAGGQCVAVPEACPEIFDPVCGCDGVTYSNDCERVRASAQKDHDGPCEPDFCDGFAGFPCDDGQFCDHPAGTCNVADGTGVCVDVPGACLAIFDPVCGCDGVTYGNDCERIRADAQKDHDGACDNICGGIVGVPCREGEICDLPAGQCNSADLQGVCRPQPQGCPDVWNPVCGCDGVTYGNDCERLSAGAQKDHDGPCIDICDGIAGFPCRPDEFCDHTPGLCNGADIAGHCVPVPDGCPRIFDPVCGCDGKTYSNDCERIRAGAQKDHDDECGDQVCGGIAGIPCVQGEVCELPAGECSSADLQGVCVTRPEVCIALFDPVCGCDGVTYGNDCERLRAGVQKDHDGMCGQDDDVCGGFAGVPCEEGEFCDLPPGQCNTADFQGTCVPRGEVCVALFDPVCGCNGVTYGNDCGRIRAGIQKDHDGVCE